MLHTDHPTLETLLDHRSVLQAHHPALETARDHRSVLQAHQASSWLLPVGAAVRIVIEIRLDR